MYELEPIDRKPKEYSGGTSAERGVLLECIRTDIELLVSRTFQVSHSELRRGTRGKASVAFARQIAMYLAHVGCGLSLSDVGRAFKRDRTTVAHACELVEDRRDDSQLDAILDIIESAIRAMSWNRNWRPLANCAGVPA